MTFCIKFIIKTTPPHRILHERIHAYTLYSVEREERNEGELGRREERKKKFSSNFNNPQVSHNTTLSYFSFQIHALRSLKHSFQRFFDGILVLELKGVELWFYLSCISLNQYKATFFHINLSKFSKAHLHLKFLSLIHII